MGGRYKDGNKFEEDQRNVDQLSSNFKCHYDENHIFSIEAILKHEQVACMRRKMLIFILKYLFLFQRFSSLYNMQISQVMTSYTQPSFAQT